MMNEPTTNNHEILGSEVSTVETVAQEGGADLGAGKFDGRKKDTYFGVHYGHKGECRKSCSN